MKKFIEDEDSEQLEDIEDFGDKEIVHDDFIPDKNNILDDEEDLRESQIDSIRGK